MSIEIYTVNHSLLSKEAEAKRNRQIQARVYQKSILDEFGLTQTIEINNKKYINDIFRMVNIDKELDEKENYILIGVQFIDKDRYCLTLYYSEKDGAVRHNTISCFSQYESDYNKSNEIINYINSKIA